MRAYGKGVLVTGGAGYIGSVLIPMLVGQGYRVRVIDSLYFGKKPLQVMLPKIELIKRDIRRVTEKMIDGVEAIIHLAALSNDPMCNFSPDLTYQVNTEATIRLARMAKASGVKRFLFASSCAVYRHAWKDKNLYREEDEVAPKEHYTRSKYLAEQVVLHLASDKFVVAILRKGTIVGLSPRQRFDLVVNTMTKTALTEGIINVFDGTQNRPVLDVTDAARAYIKLLQAAAKSINGQIFNLSYKNYLIRKLALEVKSIIERVTKRQVRLVYHPKIKDRSYRISAHKIKTRLGFMPKKTVFKSVKSLTGYLMKQNGFDFNNPIYYNIERMKELEKELP